MPREEKTQVGKKFGALHSEKIALSALLEKKGQLEQALSAVNKSMDEISDEICTKHGLRLKSTLDLQGDFWICLKEPEATSTPPTPPQIVK